MSIIRAAAFGLCLGALIASQASAGGTTVSGSIPSVGENDNGTTFVPRPYVVMGRDSSSGSPCWVGLTATCQLQVTIIGPDGPEGGVSVSINPYRASATSRSGSLTVGGSWEQVAPANALRQRLFVQNYCSAATQGITTSESLFLTFSPTMPTASPLDAPGPVELVTCGAYDTSSAVVGTAPVWVWAASTGHRWSGSEW